MAKKLMIKEGKRYIMNINQNKVCQKVSKSTKKNRTLLHQMIINYGVK